MKGPVLVVAGPTASGKTEISVALAKITGGEVVSADSMQIYSGMDIGTAKPDAREMDGVPHHMLDVVRPGEEYSVSRYETEAAVCVDDILARSRLPIICGGTGLYINALLKGSGFLPGDPQVRLALEAEWQCHGPEAMHLRLRGLDPESAARLHVNDKKRIIRALEVLEITGHTITSHNLRTASLAPRYRAVKMALYTDPRQILYDRIHSRVDDMLAMGLEAEAEALYQSGALAGTAAQAIGYKELVDYFQGRQSLEQAALLIKQKSCNYAKRQLTWFRADADIFWFVCNNRHEKPALLCNATKFLMDNRIEW